MLLKVRPIFKTCKIGERFIHSRTRAHLRCLSICSMNGKWEVKGRDRKGRYVSNNYKKIRKSVSYVSTVTLQFCDESLVKQIRN